MRKFVVVILFAALLAACVNVQLEGEACGMDFNKCELPAAGETTTTNENAERDVFVTGSVTSGIQLFRTYDSQHGQ